MALMHIKSLPGLRGRTDFVTLNLVLEQNRTSAGSWEESTLRSNPEVMSFHSKGKIAFLTEDQYASEQQREADALKAANATVEDALAEDSPSAGEAAKLAKQALDIMKRLESMLSSDPTPSKTSKSSDTAPAESKSDGLDLPMSAPPGLQPQATTQQYLKMAPAQKRKFLKECHDVGMLRDAALFEPDPKLKSAARKAAIFAEKSATEAEQMAQAAAE